VGEQIDDDESDDDDEESGGRESTGNDTKQQPDKYLVPIEVEAQIKLLWRQQSDLLDFIWSRAIGLAGTRPLHNGWEIFFMKTCLVPPNRFRPAAKVGESTAEHPQTINLSKIIDANEKIRVLQLETKSGKKAADEEGDMEASDGLTSPSTKNNELSKLVSSWIALQNAVNCYMDSAKDPNILANQSGPAGVRQILERKEGLFRKNMMGKRVNYCCRSVVSPDPYIGVNEIGIPVNFAKVLHYPTPVNDWNVKHLRSLVERGPFEYPGNLMTCLFDSDS
jgi:DNA-directed RNA polymerase I subunit RPA1